jgi:hypothetical protein
MINLKTQQDALDVLVASVVCLHDLTDCDYCPYYNMKRDTAEQQKICCEATDKLTTKRAIEMIRAIAPT